MSPLEFSTLLDLVISSTVKGSLLYVADGRIILRQKCGEDMIGRWDAISSPVGTNSEFAVSITPMLWTKYAGT